MKDVVEVPSSTGGENSSGHGMAIGTAEIVTATDIATVAATGLVATDMVIGEQAKVVTTTDTIEIVKEIGNVITIAGADFCARSRLLQNESIPTIQAGR